MWKKMVLKLYDAIKGHTFTEQIERAKNMREETDTMIDKMVADLNGCTDKWFLSPKTPLDECIPADKDTPNGMD
jgi:hypothetical protein